MAEGRAWRRLALLAVLALPFAAAPAFAQGTGGPTAAPPELEAAPRAARAFAFEGALRVLTAYVSRGFVNEDEGVVVQPEGQVVYTFVDRQGGSLAALAGGFASIHSEATDVEDPDGALDRWFELAGWVGLALDVGRLSITPYYELSDSPSGAGSLAQEAALLVAWNDAGWWHERFSISPRLLLVRETEGAADGGENGTYLGLGLEPAVAIPTERLGELRVWLPLELGLSLADYYEDEKGRDERFGYGSIGGFVSAPVPFLPGAAALELGTRHTWFGDHAREANGERGIWIGSLGLSFAY